MTDVVERLQGAVNTRQDELGALAQRLPSLSDSFQRRSQVARVVVIFLGALVAARETLLGVLADSHGIAVLFSVLGIAIAAITGIEVYFKWEGRSYELRSLGESARSTLRTVDSQWELGVGAAQSDQERITTLENIIKSLDGDLHRIRDAAARLNVSLRSPADAAPRDLYPA